MRERKCIATGEVRDDAELIRFVVGPDQQVYPDLAAKLPGRGMWVKADRDVLGDAVRRKQFNRAAGAPVNVPDGLVDLVEDRLAARALDYLGLARRAGDAALGFDAVRLALKAARPAWRLEASDGAADGRGKLDRLCWSKWGEVPRAGCFTAEEIGRALGHGPAVHVSLASGSAARGFGVTLAKLSGFRAIDPFGSGPTPEDES